MMNYLLNIILRYLKMVFYTNILLLFVLKQRKKMRAVMQSLISYTNPQLQSLDKTVISKVISMSSVKESLQETADFRELEIKRCTINNDKEQVSIDHKNFQHYTFEDFGAKGVEFTNCDFSYCVFTRAYFFQAKFKTCKFIGARFVDCNFRSARFIECSFDFAAFRGTLLPVKELLVNEPSAPGIKRLLMQSLRVNAASVGDDAAVKEFFREEMKAWREHLRKARAAKGKYYGDGKYSFSQNRKEWFRVRLESVWLSLQSFIWGYGEYPLRLMRTIILLLLFYSLFVMISSGVSLNLSVINFLGEAWSCLKYTISVFLGLNAVQYVQRNVWWWLISLIALSRYIALTLFTTMLFRRLSRR
jgi:hypothetical protein